MSDRPAIAIVSDDTQTRDALVKDLRTRFEPDYRVIGLGSTVVGPELFEEQGPLAVAIAAAELSASGSSGVELLMEVRRRHPLARRILLVGRGQWRSHPVRRAMLLGQVDGYLFVPWFPQEQWLYLPMSEYLADWSRDQPAERVAVSIVGPRRAERSHRLRDLLSRASIPFEFHEDDSDAGRAALARMGLDGSRLPAVLFATGKVVVDPTDQELFELLGFRSDSSGLDCDVAIVGAGPAGLSAAVYAASEGLSTVVVDPGMPGGQAGTSSRIRNYLGFPRGIGGSDLINRAVEQAWLFGAEFLLARRIVALDRSDGLHVLRTEDSAWLTARTVVLAMGVSWRRLGVSSVEALIGSGVFYGAAGSEADALRGEHVYVVGGGNSAGQAAVHLAKKAASVTVVIRGDSLATSMSDYLIRELDATANLQVRPNTEVVKAEGDGCLEHLILRDRRTGEEEKAAAAALFVMIGADPHTAWLPPSIARDDAGYVLTGHDAAGRPEWPLNRPPLFLETSLPGVFAIGDVRHGATRRVAPSVGSGAIAISLVHHYLGTGEGTRPRPTTGSRR